MGLMLVWTSGSRSATDRATAATVTWAVTVPVLHWSPIALIASASTPGDGSVNVAACFSYRIVPFPWFLRMSSVGGATSNARAQINGFSVNRDPSLSQHCFLAEHSTPIRRDAGLFALSRWNEYGRLHVFCLRLRVQRRCVGPRRFVVGLACLPVVSGCLVVPVCVYR